MSQRLALRRSHPVPIAEGFLTVAALCWIYGKHFVYALGRKQAPVMAGVSRLPAGFAAALPSPACASGSLLSSQPVGRGWLGRCSRVLQLQAELTFQVGILFAQIRYLPVLLRDSLVQFFNFVSQSLVLSLQLALANFPQNLYRPMFLPRCPQTSSLPGFVSKGQAQMQDSSDFLRSGFFRC
jgi:hypothetical protein